MEIIKFLKWQWNRTEKEIIVIWSIILSSLVFGALPIFIMAAHPIVPLVCTFTFLVSLAIQFAIWNIIRAISKHWKLYKDEQEKEAQAIVDKLRGSAMNVQQDGASILAQLRHVSIMNQQQQSSPFGNLTKKGP